MINDTHQRAEFRRFLAEMSKRQMIDEIRNNVDVEVLRSLETLHTLEIGQKYGKEIFVKYPELLPQMTSVAALAFLAGINHGKKLG